LIGICRSRLHHVKLSAGLHRRHPNVDCVYIRMSYDSINLSALSFSARLELGRDAPFLDGH
jgi:hypothetical protein